MFETDFSSRLQEEGITSSLIADFQDFVFSFYESCGRHDMEWRHTTDPYLITVSEIMLQQTQVPRVAEIFPRFIEQFPTAESLADAADAEVLSAWQGMGYNRRALYLKKLCRMVTDELGGVFPATPAELEKLPGIGKATSCSISAFAYNAPVVFIETNIRRVFIHFFFRGRETVDDAEIFPLVEAMLPAGRSREWYWALMDLGTEMKKAVGNPNRKSRQYVKQSKFEGSHRQVRGAVLKEMLKRGSSSVEEVSEAVGFPAESVSLVLSEMEKEGFFVCEDGVFRVS